MSNVNYANDRELYFALRAEFPRAGASHVWVVASLWPRFDDKAKALRLIREHLRYCAERRPSR